MILCLCPGPRLKDQSNRRGCSQDWCYLVRCSDCAGAPWWLEELELMRGSASAWGSALGRKGSCCLQAVGVGTREVKELSSLASSVVERRWSLVLLPGWSVGCLLSCLLQGMTHCGMGTEVEKEYGARDMPHCVWIFYKILSWCHNNFTWNTCVEHLPRTCVQSILLCAPGERRDAQEAGEVILRLLVNLRLLLREGAGMGPPVGWKNPWCRSKRGEMQLAPPSPSLLLCLLLLLDTPPWGGNTFFLFHICLKQQQFSS